MGLLAAVVVAAVQTASAQHVVFDAPGMMGQKKAPPPPQPRAQPTVWPRLDPGAVLCRTADDLERYAANMTARASGGDTQAADCQIISSADRDPDCQPAGAGRTEVKLSASDNMVGWTDVWLPDKAPATR